MKVGESSKEGWAAGDGVGRKRQKLARGLHWGVLSDLVCPCVCHPKGHGGATERLSFQKLIVEGVRKR